MTYLSFCSSELLIDKLIDRFNVPTSVSMDTKKIFIIQLRVANFFKDWLESNPEDLDGTYFRLPLIEKNFQENFSRKFRNLQKKQLLIKDMNLLEII